MALFESSNPALNEKIYRNAQTIPGQGTMTANGALNKFFLLTLMLMATASLTWNAFYSGKNITPWLIGSLFLGLIVALITIFKPTYSPYLAPVYCLLEGVVLGGLSATYNYAFAKTAPGIIIESVGITFGIVIAMFLLYRFQIIKVTEKFRSIMYTAVLGVAIFYGLSMLLSLFHIQMPLLHDNSPLGIGLSLVIVGIASLNMIMSYDRIQQGVNMGAPKYMEWYSAFGLMVAIIWLYLEILNLLSKIYGNRR